MATREAIEKLRERARPLVGKRVTVGFVTYHYLTGTLVSVDGDDAVFLVGGHELRFPHARIATLAAALPYAADFYK